MKYTAIYVGESTDGTFLSTQIADNVGEAMEWLTTRPRVTKTNPTVGFVTDESGWVLTAESDQWLK